MERKSCGGLLIPGVAAVLILAACGGSSTPLVETRGNGPTLGNEPVLLSPAQLRAQAALLGQPFYWAGPRKGYEYEFQRTSNGYVYVRYLRPGLLAGTAGRFLTISTYPFVGAFKAVKTEGKGDAAAGPGGSIVYVRAGDPTSVLIAFRGVPYEIEVYDPRPPVSVTVARSGRVQPVG